jgi:hypothetical protein
MGATGIVHVGRMTGAVSVEWEDEPGVLDHYVDWECVFLIDSVEVIG